MFEEITNTPFRMCNFLFNKKWVAILPKQGILLKSPIKFEAIGKNLLIIALWV